ncbi:MULTISPECIES: right-handed parallel beta-helix repeat-containing protein [unclassified Brevundimonas]|uniref:right-handed parallel beta-helix repeat-containing protein n=1 Tax=unclassified Brevundimonas TaxID=2622653 RepID=UPI0025BC9ED4|nr:MULTISPECIES: right-handed parallel beta-helix repeat-containing protein [unclassified Brevundimonas]
MLEWLAAVLIPHPPAPPCTDEQKQILTQVSDTPVRLECSVTLAAGDTIPRPVLIEGRTGNGVSIDCQGGTVGRPNLAVSTRRPTIAILSRKTDNGGWIPARSVRIRNCTVLGNIRIFGMGADGEYDDLRQSSRSRGHTERAILAAPSDIALEGLTITGRGSIPLYVGPGVSGVVLKDSTLNGVTSATAIYLDAESARNHITGNRIFTRTGREMIAIDGSAENRISNNRFDLHGKPGVFLYRNCGERGVIRHQTPSRNTITDNSFTGASWLRPRLVVENARNGRRSYCRDDAGYPFGSSIDDRDNASGNIIRGNSRN